MEEKETYRFDNGTGAVFKYNGHNAYEYICNYAQAGIKRTMTYKTKLKKMKIYEDNDNNDDDELCW